MGRVGCWSVIPVEDNAVCDQRKNIGIFQQVLLMKHAAYRHLCRYSQKIVAAQKIFAGPLMLSLAIVP